MKKILLIATISIMAVSCENRLEDVKEKTTYENQSFNKKSDSTAVEESTTIQSAAPEAPVDPKDIVPPRH